MREKKQVQNIYENSSYFSPVRVIWLYKIYIILYWNTIETFSSKEILCILGFIIL